MSKYATTKLVEAILVNKTTGAQTGKRIELPYGSVIEDAKEHRGFLRFTYLREIYDVKMANIEGYYEPLGGASPDGKRTAKAPAGAANVAPKAKSLDFEALESNREAARAKVLGGWLVAVGDGVTFLPDAAHKWDGSSL